MEEIDRFDETHSLSFLVISPISIWSRRVAAEFPASSVRRCESLISCQRWRAGTAGVAPVDGGGPAAMEGSR
eukprot:6195819-Pleurochrysis_carterae.AAC.1